MTVLPRLLLAYIGCCHGADLLPSQYVVTHWGVKEGLPEERIFGMAQTGDGYLWLATANGLIRYDGQVMKVFHPPEGEINREFHAIGTIPGDPSVYLSGRQGVVARFEDGEFQIIGRVKPWGSSEIGGFFLDYGDLQLMAADGVYRVTRSDLRRIDFRGGDDPVTAMVRDRRHSLWIGTRSGVVKKLNSEGRVEQSYREPELLPGPVRVLREGTEGQMFVASRGGLSAIRQGRVKGIPKRGERNQRVQALLIDREAQVWIGGQYGLALLRGGKVEAFTGSHNLPNNNVLSIFEDRESNLWVSYRQTGLHRIQRPKFVGFGPAEGIPHLIRSVHRSASGTHWIGSDAGLARIRDGKPEAIVFGEQQGINAVGEDGVGRIWAGGTTRLFWVDPTTAAPHLVRHDPDLPYRRMQRMKDGRLFIARHDGIFTTEGTQVRKLDIRGLPVLTAWTALGESKGGSLLISTEAGAWELIGDRVMPLAVSPKSAKDRIHVFHLDQAGDLWLGLDGGGLTRLRNGESRRYRCARGKLACNVYQIAEDGRGNFWLGLRAGLLRINKAELNAYLDGLVNEVSEVVYTTSDGLRSTNFGVGYLGGLIAGSPAWMCSLEDLIRIDPESVRRNPLPPPVNIQLVSVDHRGVGAKRGLIEVPARAESISVAFDAPSLVAPQQVAFRYTLEGFDSNWIGPTQDRIATYTNLPPGDYTFRATARNEDGVWNDTGASIRIHKQAYLYQELWFRLFALLAMGAGVVAFVRWRVWKAHAHTRELEMKVRERTVELEAARQQAESATHMKSDFLATMSHEIRTPMHGVLGTLELLADTPLNAEQTDHVDTIRHSSHALLTLLNDILDLSKLEAGRMELRVNTFSLRKLTTGITRTLEATGKLKSVPICVRISPGIPDLYDGDESRIRQILFNLAGNALKFTDRGEVVVSVDATRAGEKWELQFAVRDTGIGIPADQLGSLFQKFYQVDGSYRRKHGGTGLGLAISRSLSDLMNGQIDAESQEGEGSTFRFRVVLPAATRHDPAIADLSSAREHRFRGKVLLAEDNAVNRRVAERLLSRLGCEVDTAVDGREAVQKANQQNYDLILMDCHMPEMDGLEATRVIRTMFSGRRQPVIVAMTASAMAGDSERCYAAGMNGYLAKPYHRDELTMILKQHLTSEEPQESTSPMTSPATSVSLNSRPL